MEEANSLRQQDPIGIQQNEPPSPGPYLEQHGLVPENQKEQASSLQVVNLFTLQHSPSHDDSHLLQAERNMVPICQGINMPDSENDLVHHQGPERTENLDHDAQLVNLKKANNAEVTMSAISNQHALSMVMSNQELIATGSGNQPARNILNRGQTIDCDELLTVILPRLDKDRAMQLNTLYLLLTKREISKHVFLRHMKSIVGVQMLMMAAYKLDSLNVPTQLPSRSQVSTQQQNFPTPFTVQMMTNLSHQAAESSELKSIEVERLPDSHGMQLSQMSTSSLAANQDRVCTSLTPHGLKQQPQHMDLSHACFSTFGNTDSIHCSYTAMNANMSASPLTQKSNKSQMRPITAHQTMCSTQLGTTQGVNMGFSSSCSVNLGQENALLGTLNDESFEMQPSSVEFSTLTSLVTPNPVLLSMPNQMDSNNLLNYGIPSATSPIHSGNHAKTPKKPSFSKKKLLEVLGSSPQTSRKKQKVSQTYSVQSMEQLNDVTAASGINLREEEEQLFSVPKDDSHVSEASARVVQEEEEDRLILEKIPLQRRLAEIIGKFGLKDFSSDVERCLSLSAEERMRGLLLNLSRLSKQRLDLEKPRHKMIVTSDVPQQIMLINQRAQKEWEKKQARAEKLQKLDEPKVNPVVHGEKKKDEGDVGPVTIPRLMKAANVAALSAVGVDDMLSKWQLMVEQARQKHEGGIVALPGLMPRKDMGRKLSSSRGSTDNKEVEKRGQSTANSTPAAARKAERNQFVGPQSKVARTISVKDVIAVLEREPQMSKSTLIYRLYEKVQMDAARGVIS